MADAFAQCRHELIAIVGPPVFPTGHVGRGDLEALVAGRETELRLEADVTISADGNKVIVENVPFGISTDEAAMNIAGPARMSGLAESHPGLARVAGLPLANIRNMTDMAHPSRRFACIPARGTPPDELRERLLTVYGVYTTVRAELPRPLPALIRAWATAHAGEDLDTGLTALEAAR